MSKVKTFYEAYKRNCPLFTRILFFLFPPTVLLHILAVNFSAVADFINEGPGSVLRFLLAKLTGILPFSLAELVIVSVPALAVLLIVLSVRFAKKEDPRPARRYAFVLVGILLFLYISFVFTLGVSYYTATLDEKLGLEKSTPGAEDLYRTAQTVKAETEALLDSITFDETGESVMPYSFRELNDKLNAAYKACREKYPFLTPMSSRVKNILLSEPMSYTHISGVYTFPSGEANVNTAFPVQTLPFTMAHEMAHQRGIAREDEANFMAFLIGRESDDPFICYSVSIELLKDFINALAEANRDLFNALYASMDSRLKDDIKAYNRFFDTHGESAASKVSGAVNDAYQKLQGVEAGIKSYGLVVDLAVAYYREEA